jgi:hypothetical protein
MFTMLTRSLVSSFRWFCSVGFGLGILAVGSPSWAQDAQAQQSSRVGGGRSLLNPDISVILDAYAGYYGTRQGDFAATGIAVSGDDPAVEKEGFGIQEVELAVTAPIDPYLEGALFLTIPNLEGIEVEEGYLLTTALPLNLQMKAGLFRSQLGRNNGQHLHVQHFTRRPLMTPLLFGVDGLRAPGLQMSVLLPFPWFAGLYVEALAVGAPEGRPAFTTFGGGGRNTPQNLSYTATLEQFWALSDATTLFLGIDGATGRAAQCPADATMPCESPGRSFLYGGNLYLKWRPTTELGDRMSFQWTTEVFRRSVGGGTPDEGALYSEVILQFARRWYAGGRFDLTGLPEGPNVPRRYGLAGSLTFAPTEFSRFRLYAQELSGSGFPTATLAFLQAEFSMGAHGAHPF